MVLDLELKFNLRRLEEKRNKKQLTMFFNLFLSFNETDNTLN